MAEVQMTEAELEKRLNRSYAVGISVGIRQAAAYLSEIAVNEFNKGDDGPAQITRARANELHVRANKAHPGFLK